VCHKDHPADTEFVGDHPEARREKLLTERHLHLAAVGQAVEQPIGLGFVVGRDRFRS